MKLITSSGYFEKIKEELWSKNLKISNIEDIDINEEKALYIKELKKQSEEKKDIGLINENGSSFNIKLNIT